MIKLHKLALAALFALFTLTAYAAEDMVDAVDAKVDAIVMACEKQFTPEMYSDDDDRTSRINECIDSQLNDDKGNMEDKG